MKETESIEIENELLLEKLNMLASINFGFYGCIIDLDNYIDILIESIGLRDSTTSIKRKENKAGTQARYTTTVTYTLNDAYGAKLDPYVLSDSGYGDAAETYIATHYDGYFDGGARGPGQQLWWQTAVGQSSTGTSNVDDATVNQFEDYIEAATGEDNPTCTSDGFNISYNPKWVKGKVDGIDYDNPKAVFDGSTQKYTVGPFAIDYIYGGEFAHITALKVYTDASQDPIPATSVKIVLCDDIKDDECEAPAPNTAFYLQIDAIPNATKITNIQFDFKYDNGYVYYERYDSPDGYEISQIGIVLKYIYIRRTTIDPVTKKETFKDDSHRCNLTLTRKSVTNEDSQSLADTGCPGNATNGEGETTDDGEESTGGGDQGWWTSYTTLNRKESYNKATIEVEKIIVGKNNEVLSLADLGLNENSCPSFDFEIQVEGEETEIISVKPTETKTSRVYEWEGNAPTFTVKECDNQEAIAKLEALGYKIGDIKLKHEMTTATGSYDEETKTFSGTLPSEGNLISLSEENIIPSMTVHLQATNNKEPDEGSLRIVKKFKNYNTMVPGSNQKLLEQLEKKINELKIKPYKFNVEIYGNFEYLNNNEWISCTDLDNKYEAVVEVSANQDWKAPQLRWYGEAPKFKVKEHVDPNDETSIQSITPSNGEDSKVSTGTITKDQMVNVTAVNEVNFEKAEFKIIKKTNFKDYIPTDPNDPNYENKENLKRIYAEGIKSHTFNFELNVENYYGSIDGNDSGNPSKEIEVSGEIGEWEEDGENIYYVIEKDINQEFIWLKGNDNHDNPKFELIEKDDDKTTFVSAESNGLEIQVTDKKIKGRLKPGENGLTAEIENTFINEVIDPKYKIKAIELIKMIDDNEELKNKDYKFRIILRGKAFYYGSDDNKITYAAEDPQKDILVQLTNYEDEKSFEVIDEKFDDIKVVTINVGGESLLNSWQSESISWCTFVDAPTYTIDEITLGTEIEETIGNSNNRFDTALSKDKILESLNNLINGVGTAEGISIEETYKNKLISIKSEIESIADEEYNKNRSIFIIAKNTIPEDKPKTKEGNIAIVKRLENQDLLKEDDIKNLEFSFNIQIGDELSYDVVLKYDEDDKINNLYKIGDEYFWIYTTGRIVWGEDEEAPKYTIRENENNNKEIITSFVDINENGTNEDKIVKDIDKKEISGIVNSELIEKSKILDSLKKETYIVEDQLKDVTNLVTVDNEVGNKDEPKTGSIKICKEVTNGSLISTSEIDKKTFNFKVVVSGNYIYKKGGPDEEIVNGKKEFNNVSLEVTADNNQIEIDGFEWYGEAPDVTIEEIDNNFSENIGNRVWTGKLSESKPYTVVAINEEENVSGGLTIKKVVTGGNISGNEKYKFKVEIEGKEPYFVTIGANESYDLGKFTWNKNKTAPTYRVTEIDIPEGSTFVSINADKGDFNVDNSNHSVEGNLISEDSINITCINKLDNEGENDGKFKVKKVVSNDFKGGIDLSNKTFTINMLISGTFSIDELNVNIVNGSYTITEEIKANDYYESPTIKWYGKNVPVVEVSEELDVDGDDKGWRLIGISNNKSQIKSDDSTIITVTNELPRLTIIDLTLELAGKVWEDLPNDSKGEKENGYYQSTEKLIEGVKVYVYKYYTDGRRELATIFDNMEGAVINQPIITGKDGHWDAPRVKISDEGYLKDYKFDVEFVYDGQTYEPTKYLALSEYCLENLKAGVTDETRLNNYNNYGDINDYTRARLYRGVSTNKRQWYKWSSMAKDYNRATVNRRISEVKGYTAIDGNGNTTGKAVSSDGKESFIYYKADNPGVAGSRVNSKLQTLNSDGTALKLFEATARTSAVHSSFENLTYCFDDQITINSIDTTLTGQGLETTINASATYDYCLNINLGLKRRQEADVEVQKDLIEATLVVNDKKMTYEFGKLQQLNNEVQNINQFWEDIDSQNITYKLGLYKTDYYYRAEMYKASTNYDSIKEFYNKVYGEKGIDETNLEVYLKYRITLFNGSSSAYVAKINSIDDYYESSLHLVTEKVEKYIENSDGTEKEGGTKETIAVAPYYKKTNGNFSYDTIINFERVQDNILGSDGITYNKLYTDLSVLNGDNILNSGQHLDIFVTMKANVDSIEEIETLTGNEIRNNQKSNIVEIANYSIQNINTNSIAGKIDKDSAPSNIDIINRNEKSWYEEDTDEAPRLEIGLIDNGKTVSGTVWEDNKNEGNYGKYDDDEALIGGLTTQLVEKVKIQNIKNGNYENKYTDYDFVWPTNVKLNGLNGRTIEEITGFSSTIETSRGVKHEDGTVTGVGEYVFDNAPTGNFVVRFLYGNNKLALDDTSKITGNPEALKLDGKPVSENERILTANYSGKIEGKTPAIYNGQDYQATAYKYGQEGLITNEWERNLNDLNRLSDARDSESRRLELIANSQTITNVNGEILNTANNKNVSHDDLFDKYYMYADTAKLNLDNNNLNKLIEGKGINSRKFGNKNSVEVTFNNINYNVLRIDFGLVERPENKTILDKEISEIKIITNDGETIFDGIYHTSFVVKNDKDNYLVKLADLGNGEYLVAKTILDKDNSVGIDVLQALEKLEDKWNKAAKNEGTQNFRYINIEDRILQGATIEIKYNMYALNASEEDYTSSLLSEINIDETIDQNGNKVNRIKTSSEIKADILKLARDAYKESHTRETEEIISDKPESYQIGKYLGKYYYRHNTPDNDDKIVTSRVRQLIDYVDNNAVFSQNNNKNANSSWKTATITELAGNGIKENRLLGRDILSEFEIRDKKEEEYITDDNCNIILSIDSLNNVTDNMQNNEFEKELKPCTVDKDNFDIYGSKIGLTVTKTVSAEDDANNLTYDNLAEIVKFENTVGRRNVTAVPGNCNPKELNEEGEPIGEFNASVKEIDSSATELITFIPPTGIVLEENMNNEILLIIAVSLAIISIGIVVIKKKVLK